MGGYERDSRAVGARRAPARRDPGRLQRPPARGGLAALRGDRRATPRRRVPAMDEITVTRLINGPEAFTPDNEFCLGESEVRGLLRRRRLLRARPRRRRRDRQGDGRVDRRGRAAARPVGDGHPPLRRRTTARPRYTLKRAQRGLRDLLRHPLPRPRAPGRAAAARLERLRLARASTAPRSARSRAGSGSTGTSRNAAGGRRVAAPARLGGHALVAGDRRRAPRHARARRRCSTSPRSPSSRSPGPGAAEFLEAAVRQPRRARRRRDHLHADAQPPRRDRVRLHRHARSSEELLLDRHRHGVRQPRPELDPPPRAAPTAACAAPTSPRAGPASRCGARGRARSSRR